MQDKMLNKTITIDSIETKQASTGNWKYIIKDTDGDKYYFYRDNKNGQSEAFVSFNSLSPKKGDSLMISYNEEDKSFTNDQGKLINYKDRFIANIIKSSGGQQTITQQVYEPVEKGNDKFGLKLAIHGMVNGLLASGKSPQEVSELLPDLFGLEQDIELRLNKPMSLNVAEAKIRENMPVASVNDEGYIETTNIDVSDIPF